jgi:RING finger protein 113A
VDEGNKNKENKNNTINLDDDVDDEKNFEIELGEAEFPFACFICKKKFVDPVVTFCGHFFCENCAIEKNRENSKCVICSKETFGVFNVAKKLIKFIEKQNKIFGDDDDENEKKEKKLIKAKIDFKKKGRGKL